MKLRKDKKSIAVVMYQGMTALGFVGSLETLLGLELGSPYRIIAVGKNVDPVQTDTSLKIVPNQAFWEVPAPFGLIVPGGGESAIAASRNEALLSYVKLASESAELVVSIGTGSLILAEAGLLDGRQATTHWAFAEQLEEHGVRYVRQRWVEDGKFITAAGTTAGIDMSLHLVAKLTSISNARRTQLAIEYDPQPPFGGIDWDQAVPASIDSTAVPDHGRGRVPAKEHA